MDELRLSVTALDAHVIIVTESWLSSDIDDDLLGIANFEIFRCDRNVRKGGGVCVWSDSRFRPHMVSNAFSVPSCLECVAIRLFCGTFSLLCCAVYIPPGLRKFDHDIISEFLTIELDKLLTLFPHDKIVIAGDFNDFSTSHLIDSFCLVNRVDAPTRNHSILDQILIHDSLCDSYPSMACVGPPLDRSDHNSIILRAASLSQFSEYGRRQAVVWDYRESNMHQFLKCLSTTDFKSIVNESSVDNMCSRFYELLAYPLSQVPHDIVYFSSNDKPWMTPLLKSLINKRWIAYREGNWPLFRHYKSKVRFEILKAKRIWCHKQSQTTRGLWNVVRSMRGTTSKDQWLHLLQETGSLPQLLIALTKELSSNFNTGQVDLLPFSDQEWNMHISPETVYEHLSKLKCCKAIGPDNVPARLLKVGARFLCDPLATIFNLSIRTKTFPLCFKRAHVCPIPKNSNPSIQDFRPISLLSPLSKVFERIVFENIKLQLFSCYGSHQHAYRPLGSTTTALIDLCEQITKSLDSKDVSHVNVFCLDLSKAFDQLQHNRLLNYLRTNGFNHGFLRWLQSYLSFRSMRVKVMNTFGPVFDIPSGVPQGSVLGPFLFAAFMGAVDFSHINNVHCVKYADDVTLVEPLLGNNKSLVTLDDCVVAFTENGLNVNRAKCKQLHVCFRRSLSCENDVSGFPCVQSLRILGVHFTDRLTWETHISNILKIVSQRLYVVRCMKSSVCKDELIRIYHAINTAVIFYASPVYGLLPSTLLAKLERFQRRAHRLICGAECNCDGFPPIRNRFQTSALKILLRAESDSSHPLHPFVPERLPSTRRFRNPPVSTTRRLNSFFPWTCRTFNSLT